MKEKIVITLKSKKLSSVNEKLFKGSEGKFENVCKIYYQRFVNKDAQVFKFNLLLTSSFDDARFDLIIAMTTHIME